MSYSNFCENCGKSFNEIHYTWFICLKCHKKIDKKEYQNRLRFNEELD